LKKQKPNRGDSDDVAAMALKRDELAPIFRRSMFWTPERQAPSAWAWTEHVPFAFWLVDVLRPSTIVELGTHNGVSYSAMCQAVKSLGLPTRCFAVDTWKGDEQAGFYPEEVYREFATFHDQRYSAFSRLVRSTFDEALPHFEDGSIDLLHIDGLHTYDAVRHDFESWLPKLSPNAVILFHDTNVRENNFGVFRLWGEIASGRLHFDFLHGYGLGVLGLGHNYSNALRFFFDASEDNGLISSVREIFASLGKSAFLLCERSAVNQALAEREVKVATLHQALTERDRELGGLRDALADGHTKIAVLDQALAEREAKVVVLDQTLAERDRGLGRLRDALTERDAGVAALQSTVSALRASTSWRITAPLRWARRLLWRLRDSVISYPLALGWRARGTFSLAPLRGWRAARGVTRENIYFLLRDMFVRLPISEQLKWRLKARAVRSRFVRYLLNGRPGTSPSRTTNYLTKPIDRYDAWLACNEPHEKALHALRDALAARRGRLPRMSVIMPVYNTPTRLLDEAISSVIGQVYEDWELCIADDASTDRQVSETLARWAAIDDRIRIAHRGTNGGISLATNTAAGLATGEFLALLDHDDLLTPDALGEVAIWAADNPDTDIIYSDDDKIDMSGHRYAPQFKPDWSPVLLLSYMYMGHLLVVRRSLFDATGGMRQGFEGSQDHDLALRACEQARRIGHIPRILYHWRAAPGSVATTTDVKPYALDAGLRAVQSAFERRKYDAVVDQPDWAKRGKVGIYTAKFPDAGPSVTILIPTRNRLDLLRPCLESLRQTTYRNYEVVILDNESDERETMAFLATCGHRVVRVRSPNNRFSFAHINNYGAKKADTDFIVFLNDDTQVIEPRWLSQMMGYARMPGTGAVGAKLIYNDGTIQHGGIVHGYHDGMAGHAFKNMPADERGYLAYMNVAREYSGVTAACLLTPRKLFVDTGGLDEANFAVAYNDVDYCYRLQDLGYSSVLCPQATLIHHEGKSRGFGDNPKEVSAFRRRYRGRVDRYYNPNLSLDNEHFEIQPYRHPLPDAGRVRIVAISHNLNHEGAPNSQFEVILGLQRRGIIDPIVLSPIDGPLRQAYEAAGIPVQIVSSIYLSNETSATQTIGTLAKTFQESGAELVYANTLQSFWAVAAAEEAKIPALWNIRESEPWQSYFDYLASNVRALAYRAFRYPYRIVFVADATQKAWAPLNTHYNFTVVHNGLDLNRIGARADSRKRASLRSALGIEDAEIAIVLMGTVCDRKGQLDLIRALGSMSPDSWSQTRTFIVGDRPNDYSSKLHAELADLPAPLAGRIKVEPETDDPYRYFQAADIGICCSRIESYPRVTLEAMAFGLPLITTPVFGIAEQVRNNINGVFYTPGNYSELAAHLKRMVLDDAWRAQLATNSRPVLESLPNFEEMLDGYAHIFREARLSRGKPVSLHPSRRPV
jgi:GT2 family glycosyltransferase/glycosyltransferase involved in cell wall biosynthesis